MTQLSLSLGRLGENAAAQYLLERDFKILQKNARYRYGEIDIIASKNSIIYIFEVKTRLSSSHSRPYEAVTRQKADRLIQMGEKFSLQNNLKQNKLSFGVISILANHEGVITSLKIYDYFI